ncbi:MAG: hypothetical protein V7609_3207 [Verrucomicrobiota bacterium]
MKLILSIAIALTTCLTGLASLTVSNDRPYWRFCNKCNVMFSTEGKSNSCAAGGSHVPQGYEFRLPYDSRETKTAQTKWRCCRTCQAMFYDGYPAKGRCPGGGAHRADNDFRYVLPHDVPETPTAQANWRYCHKCSAMFYNGFPKKGTCPAGESHVAAGYNFVLPHPR